MLLNQTSENVIAGSPNSESSLSTRLTYCIRSFHNNYTKRNIPIRLRAKGMDCHFIKEPEYALFFILF